MTATNIIVGLLLFPLSALAQTDASLYSFYDDFEDNDISDWEERCAGGVWYASGGCVRGNTGTSPACLAAPCTATMDCVVSTRAMGTHAFGLLVRLDENDNGIIAYVSPDADVARIRLVESGSLGETLASTGGAFPSGVWYELELSCDGPSIHFTIDVPSTSDHWEFSAVDPSPHEGVAGLNMGDEDNAYWDWFELVSISASGDGFQCGIAVDDDLVGESSGDDDLAFEAGEEIELSIELRNITEEPLTNVFAVLQSLDPDLTVTDNYEDYPDLSPDETGWCLEDFGVEADPSTPDGEHELLLTIFADGGFQEQEGVILPTGCGITCDVESESTAWYMSVYGGAPWGNNWHISSERNHTPDGLYSFKCGDTGSGDYDDMLYCIVSSPIFNVPRDAELTFWMWIDAQMVRGSDAEAYDGGLVAFDLFGPVHILEPTGGYPFEIVEDTTGPFEPGTSVFSGTYGWQQVIVLIPDSLCGPQKLMFFFGSDAAGTREGWYVDDILLSGPTGVEEDEAGPSDFIPLSISAVPSPFDLSTTLLLYGVSATGADIRVFDCVGRLVWTDQISPAESQSELQILWDATDSDGHRLPPGVYFASCSSGGQASTVRLVILE